MKLFFNVKCLRDCCSSVADGLHATSLFLRIILRQSVFLNFPLEKNWKDYQSLSSNDQNSRFHTKTKGVAGLLSSENVAKFVIIKECASACRLCWCQEVSFWFNLGAKLRKLSRLSKRQRSLALTLWNSHTNKEDRYCKLHLGFRLCGTPSEALEQSGETVSFLRKNEDFIPSFGT